ncbi:hypothetical protein [Pleionea sediminis]|uniref:hypothetical protein n=1 Tax=Pleionea sediminis TaxID=2569479 RepID=UPI00197BBF81|nr:hypothetical protein [Pleionea sediminis]
MKNIAVLMQVAGLILTFSIGWAGLFIGPLLLIAGGVMYRRETKLQALEQNTPDNHQQNNEKAIATNKKPVWPKVLGGIAVVIGLIFSAVFILTADLTKTANEFFQSVKNNDIEKAYTFLSEDFKAQTSKAELMTYLKKTSLDQFVDANWSNRSRNGNRGLLTGSITTESGGVVPVSLSFVKSAEAWKIFAIQMPTSGIKDELVTAVMPSEDELVRLASETMAVFAESVYDSDMSKLYNYTSQLWQKQSSPDKLDEGFSSFYGKNIDLRGLSNMSPQFTKKPQVNSEGVLLVEGQYPTKQINVSFEFKYIFEGIRWKLIGLSVNLN